MSSEHLDSVVSAAADHEFRISAVAKANADKAMAELEGLHESLGGTGGHT